MLLKESVPDVKEKRKNGTENLLNYDAEKMVFVDESGVNINMTRIYGRSLGGTRCVDKTPLNTPTNTTGDKFVEYLKNILIPTLNEGDIIVMDNIRSHHVKKVSEIINHSEKHLTLLYLPAYSPDFNPIEMMWSKIKSILRTSKVRDISMLTDAIKTAFLKITTSDCIGWFSAVGLR